MPWLPRPTSGLASISKSDRDNLFGSWSCTRNLKVSAVSSILEFTTHKKDSVRVKGAFRHGELQRRVTVVETRM